MEPIKQIIESLDITETALKNLEKELSAAHRLLWTVIYMSGTEVRIPDHVFRMTEGDQELETFYDNNKRETVLRSKISIPKFDPSATEPDKT